MASRKLNDAVDAINKTIKELEKTKTGLGDSGIFRASTDFGFNLGTGYDIAENINLSFRYFIGLKNIIEYIEPFEVRNTNLAFAVGYKF